MTKHRTCKPFVLFNLNDPLFNKIVDGKLCGRGSYKGVVEDTYRLYLDKDGLEGHIRHLTGMLAIDMQSYALYVDNRYNAYLVDCRTGVREYQGEFKQIDWGLLDKGKDYTQFFGNPDSYYYIRSYGNGDTVK